jgi:hypothetical protein
MYKKIFRILLILISILLINIGCTTETKFVKTESRLPEWLSDKRKLKGLNCVIYYAPDTKVKGAFSPDGFWHGEVRGKACITTNNKSYTVFDKYMRLGENGSCHIEGIRRMLQLPALRGQTP